MTQGKRINFAQADIDWLAVEMVAVEGKRLALTAEERRAVVRRVKHRMLGPRDGSTVIPPGMLTAGMVAQRMGTTERSVQRILAELPPAAEKRCPVCGQRMWVLTDGTVEQHPNRINERCDMSGRETLTGLASIRPDLYGWVVAS